MSLRTRILGLSAAVLVMAVSGAPGVSAASIDGKFNAAVERLLLNMKEGAVAEMSQAEKKELVACVQKVFGKITEEKKRYIAEASDHSELKARFDEVGLENRAALKQQVRDECS